jgi:hypothetical protein
MGMNYRLAISRDLREWRNILLEAKVHNGLYRLRRRFLGVGFI